MSSISLSQIIIAIIFAALTGWCSYRFQLLSLSGSLAASTLGLTLYGLGGWQWSVPMIVFFMTSSVLSKRVSRLRSEIVTEFEKPSRRDAWQVAANGGMSGLFVILWAMFPDSRLYYLNLGALASVTADTWGTEIGILVGSQPILITSWKKVGVGTSGAVSIPGTVAGCAGALVIGMSGWFWLGPQILNMLIIITLSGIIGSMSDSILGYTAQVHYRCLLCKKITEKKNHCKADTVYERGMPAVNNDVVNFLSGIVGAVSTLILIELFQLS